MLKIILEDEKQIHPFNERARDIRIHNVPLWLNQRDLLAEHVTGELEISLNRLLPQVQEPCLIYRDNLYFDREYIQAFIKEAKAGRRAVRAAFKAADPVFKEHALPLSTSYTPAGDLYLADLWYYPQGPGPEPEPLVIDPQMREIGYYHVPTYMASEHGDLVFMVPLRGMMAIDSWVHIFIADVVFGLFSKGARFERDLEIDPWIKLRTLWKGMMEGRQVLESSMLVEIGRNCQIDPTAIIHGPTVIGDNVTIGAGAVIENCIIGSNVNISQGCQLMLSVVGDGSFLPFRAALFMTTLMENAMVAQNTCLQMSVIGRNTFIGAGSTFTDFKLIPSQLRALAGDGKLRFTNREVLGGCVGHNCRIGSGLLVMPGRTIESDVILLGSGSGREISSHISFEQSDHHRLRDGGLHQRQYPRKGETGHESW
jgi:carbonic anhydrase/acetyltransferase-like protein (isoleucine patch superfamily)